MTLSVDAGNPTLLVLLDITAAFDTVTGLHPGLYPLSIVLDSSWISQN